MKNVSFLCLNSIHAINGPVIVHKIEISQFEFYLRRGFNPSFVFKEGVIDQFSKLDFIDILASNSLKKISKIKAKIFDIIQKIRFLRVIIFFYKLYRLKKGVNEYFSKNISSDVIVCDSELECFFVLKKCKAGTKILLYQHNDGLPYKMTFNQYPECAKLLWRIFKGRLTYVLGNVDGIVFLSHNFRNNFSKEYNFINEHKLAVIPNGIPDRFVKRKKNVGRIKIVCAGTLTKRKGQGIIVEALSKLNAHEREILEVIFFGNGPEFEKIQKNIEDQNLAETVKLYGEKSNELIVEEMINSHIVILMSEDEGMPLSILEGMMAGCAIISTDVGCIAEMIYENCGYIVNRDSDSLSKLLRSLDFSVLIDMGLRSREKYLEAFTSKKMINNQIIFLNKLLS